MSLIPDAYERSTVATEGYKYETSLGSHEGRPAVCKYTDDPELVRKLRIERMAYETVTFPETAVVRVPEVYHHAEANGEACLVMERFERYVPTLDDWDDPQFRHNLLDSFAAVFAGLDAFEPPDSLGSEERRAMAGRGTEILEKLEYNNDEDYEGDFDAFPALRQYKSGITTIHEALLDGAGTDDDVIHGDLFLANMALRDDGYLRGVFDFEKFGYGDRAREYAAIEASVIGEFYASEKTSAGAETVRREFRERVGAGEAMAGRIDRYRALQHFHVLVFLTVFDGENALYWDAVGTADEARKLHHRQLRELLDEYA